jgi:uncharacterized coiled-coil DUF342 family protein
MTQVEFENQLRELNGQKAQVMNMYALMQNEVKEEIAEKNGQIHELSEQVQRLKVQRAGLTERRLKAEREWGDKIRKFTSENFSETRALADVSEWSLAAELRHRGYTGQLINPEKVEEFMMNLNGKLNGCINGKAYGKED